MLAPMTPKIGTHGLQSLVLQVDRRLGQRWQFEILAVGLAFHMLSFKAFGQGLLDFSDAPRAALTGPNAALALAAFVIATYLLPSLGAAVIWVLERLEALGGAERAPHRRAILVESGWVRLSQARDAALIERDAFWTARVDQEFSARDRRRAARRRLESQVFALLFLLVLDLACPNSLAIGLLQLVTRTDCARELLGISYLAASLRWCVAVLEEPPPTLGMIYHPVLAQHLGAKAKQFAGTLRSR
jgi:hypothetical protein